ncbi:Ger(x)C family spore germination C-terminal domain-containing protein, partial [Paenibacillus sp. TAF58]
VIYKKKLVGWLEENDVLAVNVLVNGKSWKNINFPESIVSKSDLRFSALFHVLGSEIHSGISNGSPKFNINLKLTASVEDINHDTEVNDSGTITQMEHAAAEQIERRIKGSLDHFQKVLKIDIIGFSDYFRQHHPKEWKTIQKDWEKIYPTIPVQVQVSVKIEKSGMTTSVRETN